MKNLYLILCICLILLISVLMGRHSYLKNADSMRKQAESAFLQVLKQKTKVNDISFHVSNIGLDTAHLVVFITTASGKQKYTVDTAKSKKNISQSHLERTLQSFSLMKNPLVPDTLNGYWQNVLCQGGINAKTTIDISITDLYNEVSCCRSSRNAASASSQFTYITYIGNRCEVEVTGHFCYSWWMVFLYHWSPFFYLLY